VAYNPNILQEVLRARSLSRPALSERLGIGVEELDRELKREPEPRQGILNDIATELALPPFVFYMKVPPPLDDVIPDFRSARPGPTPNAKATTESIQFAAAVQRTAEQLDVPAASKLPTFDVAGRDQIENFALSVRTFFGVSLQDQAAARDAKAFFNYCRKKIEDRGIFVLQDSFPQTDGSGFCLAHPRYPLIVINTKQQTRGRRLFTLIHELAHVLMGQSGISDPFIRKNAIETRCNKFASSFLVPMPYLGLLLKNTAPPADPDIDDVARIARRLKMSQQATIIRLEELRLVRSGSHERWLVAIHNTGNPDYSERGGGGAGGPPPQEKVKLAKYGFHFAASFDAPLRQGRISEINLYRATGLKPKYQREYFDFAKSISNIELENLDLDDV
jgi:Zn-dependent peptidase ImmA (M78 family)